jgi:hypothetical protein
LGWVQPINATPRLSAGVSKPNLLCTAIALLISFNRWRAFTSPVCAERNIGALVGQLGAVPHARLALGFERGDNAFGLPNVGHLRSPSQLP